MADYRPHPVSLDHVLADPGLRATVEAIAESIHDAWAAQRMAQGWRHGPQSDPARKLHASLVPYEELSEEEKDVDRRVAATAVAVLLGRGHFARSPVDDPAI